MLTGSHDDIHLPQTDLTYAAFRLAVIDTLIQIEMAQQAPGGPEPVGYLDEVPVLAAVAPAVQVDLLADTWARHRSAEPHRASLLDAAVIYAACQTAARIVEEQPELAGSHLATGPLACDLPIDRGLPERFQSLFESFWSDVDFLTLEHLADTDPAKAGRIKKVMGISNNQIKKLEAALGRFHARPQVLTRLEGLLTEPERRAWSRWLVPPLVVSLRDVVSEMDTLGDGFQAYLNRKTGELFTASEDELRQLDAGDDDVDQDAPAWQVEVTSKLRSINESEDWLQLPSKREFHEWEVMADFCRSVANDTLREDLLDAIRGSGAFGRFKSMIHRHGLIDDWYRFCDEQFMDFAAAWLRANGIAYRK